MRRARPARSLVLWSLVAFAALLFLELLPGTGPLLARAGAAYVAGWLVQICLLATLVDAARGALPRPVAVVPLLVYAGYWFAVWEQARRVDLRSEALQNSNPGVVLAFDPVKHALVTDNAETFAVSHAIPIVYAHDPSRADGYLSYRLAARAGAGSSPKAGRGARNAQDNTFVSVSATVPGGLLIASSLSDHPGDLWKDWGIGELTTEVAANGATLGAFRSAYVDRLPPLPFVTIGCTYAANGARRCSAGFVTQRLTVESRPKSVDRNSYDDGLSVMLKIPMRSDEDSVRTHDVKVVPGTRPPPEPAAAEDAAFAELEGVIKGGESEPASPVARTVADNPSRLAPLASLMASRFLELHRTKTPDAPGRQRKLSLLAMAISALSPSAFAAVQDQLTPVVGELSAYPLLYLRLADAGVAVYPHYRDQITRNSVGDAQLTLSILAICRLGFADNELISSMKSKLDTLSEPYTNPALASAIFITMMRLGQENIAAEFNPPEPSWLRTWRTEVLSGKGRTDVGPNNCMPAEWPLEEEVPSVMAPGLVWVRGGWRPRLGSAALPVRANLD